MSMFNPPHPGEFIKETYIDPFEISQNELSDRLNVARSTFSRLIRGEYRVSPEMACRLAKVIGRSPESWLTMQSDHDLFEAKKEVDLKGLRKVNFEKINKSDFSSRAKKSKRTN